MKYLFVSSVKDLDDVGNLTFECFKLHVEVFGMIDVSSNCSLIISKLRCSLQASFSFWLLPFTPRERKTSWFWFSKFLHVSSWLPKKKLIKQDGRIPPIMCLISALNFGSLEYGKHWICKKEKMSEIKYNVSLSSNAYWPWNHYLNP